MSTLIYFILYIDINVTDKLKKSAPSRIVVVSSLMAKFAKLDLDKLVVYPSQNQSVITDMSVYSTTKLCNILFTTELAKKIKNTGVTVNVLHPGAVATNIARNMPSLTKFFLGGMGIVYFKVLFCN